VTLEKVEKGANLGAADANPQSRESRGVERRRIVERSDVNTSEKSKKISANIELYTQPFCLPETPRLNPLPLPVPAKRTEKLLETPQDVYQKTSKNLAAPHNPGIEAWKNNDHLRSKPSLAGPSREYRRSNRKAF
jgi:hypothetical protein